MRALMAMVAVSMLVAWLYPAAGPIGFTAGLWLAALLTAAKSCGAERPRPHGGETV